MGYITALLSRDGGDIAPQMLGILEVASPARVDAKGIAYHDGVIVKASNEELQASPSAAMLGHLQMKIRPSDPPQPLSQHGYAMAFEGRIWGSPSPSDPHHAADIMGRDPAEGIRSLLRHCRGSFSVAVLDHGRILCARDPVGTIPLYLGKGDYAYGIASNRKTLWTAGLEASTMPPGHLAEISEEGVKLERVSTLEDPDPREMTMEEAVDDLDMSLTEAVEDRCMGLFRVALGFSGGIDSTILAHYMSQTGAEVDLVCVGLEGSAEFEAAELAADSLDLPLRLESFTSEDVDRDLDAVLWSIEEPDSMKAGVALPLHWAARCAVETGCRVIFSGNGSDELFGGYHRHVQEYAEAGGAVRRTLFRNVAGAHSINYERDHKVCADLGVELRLPYADPRVIQLGLSIPVELKLPSDPGEPRKKVLRALAERLGLPDEVAYRRKKAVQYSTGVSKALEAAARRSGRSLQGYLSERFEKLRETHIGYQP